MTQPLTTVLPQVILSYRAEDMKKLSIIIVSYNVKYYLEQCLDSVRRAIDDIDAEVFVVDNHSKDGSAAYLERRFPEFNFVSSNHNLGFARANNIGIRESDGEFVLLLNPDTIVGETVLRECLSFMESHQDAGACGVEMLQANGEAAKESRRGIPDPMTAFFKMSGLCARFPKNAVLGHYYMGDIPWDKPGEIEIVSGAFCMMRRAALEKVGLLDEDFFMYGEDIDLSYRLLKGGYKNYYFPCKILHYKGESTQRGPSLMFTSSMMPCSFSSASTMVICHLFSPSPSRQPSTPRLLRLSLAWFSTRHGNQSASSSRR